MFCALGNNKMACQQQLLDDARAAYHRLMTGKSVREVRDQNGETVTYTVANAAKLAAYIAQLEAECAKANGRGRIGPLGMIF